MRINVKKPIIFKEDGPVERKFVAIGAIAFLMFLALPLVQPAGAEDVGKFTQVVKTVDHMKGGQPPAVQAKVEDKVANKDVVETHKQSRAQMKFVDETTVTVAPQSKVTIDEYMCDLQKGKCKATMRVLQGLVHTVVPPQKEKPDLMTKTTNATMGIRG